MCDQLYRLARRISDNRVIAGIHFPIDGAAGYALARALSDFFIARSDKHGGAVDVVAFDGRNYRPNADIDPRRVFEKKASPLNATMADKKCPPAFRRSGPAIHVAGSKLLNALWASANDELRAQGF